MFSKTLRLVAVAVISTAVLLAAAGCGSPDDAKAQAALEAATLHLRNYAASTDQFNAALQRYSEEAKKGPANVKKALPNLDEAQSVLATRSLELSAATAQLAKIDGMQVSSNSRDTAKALGEMVVIAQEIDVKLSDIISVLRDSGTYVASGGKDQTKLKGLLDRTSKDTEALTGLYRQLSVKQAEVSRLLSQ